MSYIRLHFIVPFLFTIIMEYTPTTTQTTIPRPNDNILKNMSKNIAIELIDGVLDVAGQSSIRKYINGEKVCQDTWKDIYEYLYSLHDSIVKDIQEYRDEYERYGRSYSMQFYDEERNGTLSQYLMDITIGEGIREDFMSSKLDKFVEPYIDIAGGRREDDVDCNRWDDLMEVVSGCIFDKIGPLYEPLFEPFAE